MKAFILEAKQIIEKENVSFGYTAGPLEIAADIWHNHFTTQQRVEVLNRNPEISRKNVGGMYKAIAEFFNA